MSEAAPVNLVPAKTHATAIRKSIDRSKDINARIQRELDETIKMFP